MIKTSNFPVPTICKDDSTADWFASLDQALGFNTRMKQRVRKVRGGGGVGIRPPERGGRTGANVAFYVVVYLSDRKSVTDSTGSVGEDRMRWKHGLRDWGAEFLSPICRAVEPVAWVLQDRLRRSWCVSTTWRCQRPEGCAEVGHQQQLLAASIRAGGVTLRLVGRGEAHGVLGFLISHCSLRHHAGDGAAAVHLPLTGLPKHFLSSTASSCRLERNRDDVRERRPSSRTLLARATIIATLAPHQSQVP